MDYSYSSLGGDCTVQDGGYTPIYSTSGYTPFMIGMVKTLNTWTSENAEKQQIEDYENGRITEEEYD